MATNVQKQWPRGYRPFDEDAFYEATAKLLATPPRWQVKVRHPNAPLNVFRRQYLASQIYGRRLAMEDLYRELDEIAETDGAVVQYTGYAEFSDEAMFAVADVRHKLHRFNEQCLELATCLRNLGGPVGDYRATAPHFSTSSADLFDYRLPGRFVRGDGPLIPLPPVEAWVALTLFVVVCLGIAALVILIDVFGG